MADDDKTLAEDFADNYEDTELTDEVDAPDEVAVEATEETDEAAVEAEATQEATEEAPVQAEAAPERWPDDMKQAYANMAPEAQGHFMNAFKGMQRSHGTAMQEVSELRKTAMPVLETLNRYQDQFRMAGVDPVTALEQQFAWAAHLQRVGPQQYIQDFVQQHQLDPSALKPQEDEYLTPTERGLKEQLTQMSQALNALQQGSQQQSIEARQAEEQAVNIDLNRFINDQDGSGNLTHPHVERVAPVMTALLRQPGIIPKADEYGRPIPYFERFEAAYNRAVLTDPDLQATAAQQQQVDNIEQQKRQAQKIQRASRQVVDKSPSDAPGQPVSFADALGDAFDAAQSS